MFAQGEVKPSRKKVKPLTSEEFAIEISRFPCGNGESGATTQPIGTAVLEVKNELLRGNGDILIF